MFCRREKKPPNSPRRYGREGLQFLGLLPGPTTSQTCRNSRLPGICHPEISPLRKHNLRVLKGWLPLSRRGFSIVSRSCPRWRPLVRRQVDHAVANEAIDGIISKRKLVDGRQ